MLLAVSYHYIATERRSDARAIFPTATVDFAAQLDQLGRSFEFVARDDVLGAIEGGSALPRQACLVTFDDGLREQVELALPVLNARGIPAVFFVCGAPLAERRVLYAHKVHLLREAMNDEDLLNAVEDELLQVGAELSPLSTIDPSGMYPYDSREAASLKYLLNIVLGPSRPEPIDAVFASCFSEREVCDELYLSAEQIAELENKGALGAHGYSHRPLAALETDAIKDDLERCATVLCDLTGARPRALSYPYGTAAAVTHAVAREAVACGFAFGLTMERAVNRSLNEPLLLARVDAQDAPGGRNPLLMFDGDAVLVREPLTAGRARYLDEAAA
jgi:peptidoglycan/xylan/chitin deacetylase (PgdA/CDA1 family)